MPISTVADVISALNQIVQHCEQTQNRAGYFAALYKRITIAVSEGIAKGAFEDGARMEKLDLTFAQRYLTAYEAYNSKEAYSTSWKYAFDGCIDQSLTVIQLLMLGINTQINLDLAIASAVTAPGSSIYALKNDFDCISNVIVSLFNDVEKCLEEVWLPMRWLKTVGAAEQANMLDFSINTACKTAWANAVLLANMDASQQQAYIQEIDVIISDNAQKIITPGLRAKSILNMIKMTGFEDVARTIRLIDTIVLQ